MYTSADYGFFVIYPAEWAETESETILFVAQAATTVPVLFVDIAEGATFPDALSPSMQEAGGSNLPLNPRLRQPRQTEPQPSRPTSK
ncbi:MAG: hypothetical protein ISS52_02255 [Dehalococcoidia bacterium]|nr:hypothetical protein [Dehalococcoidia bacterium]